MSRYIDADELWRDFTSADKDDIFGLEDVEEILDNATIIESIEPCEDAISREAVIKVFKKDYDDVFDIMTDIEELPSVAPSRPSGEWRLVTPKSYTFEGYRCSNCNYLSYGHTRFCSNCGAKMKGADDESTL